MAYNIAIDGPAGAGKSTIAKNVSKELGYIYIDTGAMYRTIALFMLENKIDTTSEAAVSEKLDEVNVSLKHLEGSQHIFLNGRDVSTDIRQEIVGNTASVVSAYGPVRAKLLDLQRSLAAANDCIMDGRDIGSFVLPDADLKIYLTASVEARAKRRYDELTAKGVECDMAVISADIEERDYRDMHREIAPLVQAEDAVYLDSSDMNIEEVTDKIISLVRH